jgi:hypothetical protein
MEPLHVAHLVVLAMWLGVVITEVLFEFAASDAESLRAAARFHYKVDKIRRAADIGRRARHWYDPVGARLAMDAAALHQDCGIVGRSGCLLDVGRRRRDGYHDGALASGHRLYSRAGGMHVSGTILR